MVDQHLRDLAEIHLLRLVGEFHNPNMNDGSSLETARETFEGALEACLAVGAISNSETGWWRELHGCARAIDAIEPAALDREAVVRARIYVEGLIDAIGADSGAGDAHLDTHVVHDALEALHAVGVFGPAERAALDERLRVAAEAHGVRVDEEAEEPDDEERFTGSELRDVLVGPDEPVAGVRVICVERYADGLVLRWRQSLAAGKPSRGERKKLLLGAGGDQQLLLYDDVDTDFWLSSSGSGGDFTDDGRYVIEGHSEFVPAVPSEARRLSMALEGEEASIDLPDASAA